MRRTRTLAPAPVLAFARRSLAALLLAVASPALADPPGLKTLPIGAAAPDFDLPGVDGKNHKLADYADKDILVVLFTCNHCPTAQAYEERIKQLHADYKDRGVALVAISPNDAEAVRLDELGYTDLGDSLADMKIRAKDKDFRFPYLYDGETQKASFAYGALATPHVFIFDKERKLRYNGRIDDSEVKTPRSHDARNAIEALLAGKPVPVETTRVFGCSTKWSDKRESAREAVAKWDQEPVSLTAVDTPALAKILKDSGGKYRLVNLWATWCGPCVEELPEFVTMHRMYRKRDFELITISVDQPEAGDKALAQLRELHLSARNLLFASDDHDELAETVDPEWAGPIPYTVLIDPSGKVVYRQAGQVDPLELRRVIADHLGRTY